MKFQLPDQLPATTGELNDLADQARAEITVLQARHNAGEELSAADTDRLEYLLDARDKLVAESEQVAAAEQAHTDKLASLLDRATTKPEPADPVDVPAAQEDSDADAVADVVAEAEAVAAQAAEQPEPVTAASPVASRPFANIVTSSEVPKGRDGDPGKRWSLVSSAPNFAEFSGQLVDTEIIAAGISSKSGKFTGIRPGTPTVLAKLERRQDAPIKTRAEFYAALDRATDPQALVAAGGWVAPSVQEYGFEPTIAPIGLLNFPAMTLERGGLIVPDEPDFSALQTGFHFTEAELEAEVDGVPTATKSIVEIPAVDDMIEYRLEAIGWGVKSGILQTRAWPELIKKFLDEFLVAHQYRISAKSLLKVLAASSAAKVVPTDAVLGATTGILNGLHVRARNIQIKSRRPIVEGIAPIWFRDVLRADLAMRDGLEALSVTDAQVDAWLAERGIYLQYEGRWQSLDAGKPGHEDTARWPSSVDVVLYSAGAFWRAQDNVLTLGVQYPLEMVEKNRRLEGFVEDEFQVGKKPGFLSHLIRIPLCVNGAVGAREEITCSYSASVLSKTAVVTVTGTPTGGTLKLNFSSNDIASGTIAYNATAATVDTTLTAIDDAVTAAGDITVTGSAGGPWTVVYPASLGDLELHTNSLTGGTDPGVTIALS